MVLKINYKELIKNLAIPLLVGFASGILTRSGVESFSETAVKPAFMPPDWLFPVAWTILYILMGISAYIVQSQGNASETRVARVLYLVQLFFNFCWSFIFFNFQAYLFAFIWIIILWLLIIATTIEFSKTSKLAAYLMIPYILWVTFAAVLNFSIYLLN